MIVTTDSAEETQKFGEEIATKLQLGDLVLLKGDLGAGKTTLVQGIAKGLNAEIKPNSPSFAIANEYKISNGIFRHIDLYRLDNPEVDIDTLGLPEMLTDEKAITVLEWPERLQQMWERKGRTIEIIFSYGVSQNQREIAVSF
jgi:tRNA threonylcarbamoyladenosine biosynthesis protein TsaE